MARGVGRALACVMAASLLPALAAPQDPLALAHEGTHFTLRANPRWAAEINAVLARIALPKEVSGTQVDAAIAITEKRCGTPVAQQLEGQRASPSIAIPPCVQFRENAPVKVLPGDTLEAIALRNGLAPAAVAKMKIAAVAHPGRPARVMPTSLWDGDTVVIPKLPLWTEITTGPVVARGRLAFVAALAKALPCGGEEADACLVRHGVFVMERRALPRPATKMSPRPSVAPVPPPAPEPTGSRAEVSGSVPFSLATPVGDVVEHRGRRAAVAAEEPTVAVEPTAGAMLLDADPLAFVEGMGLVRVAADQWPYDATLLAAILEDKAQYLRDPSVIGIADGALADRNGAPLPPESFVTPAEREPDGSPEVKPDSADDDDNGFVDDLIGAGTLRPGELLPTGDLGLCDGASASVDGWLDDDVTVASHGSIVATLAAAPKVRALSATAAAGLPKITFFRLLSDSCVSSPNFRVTYAEMGTAFTYLNDRAGVVCLSYELLDTRNDQGFMATVRVTLENGEKLLIIPAGNDSRPDLDDGGVCPPCLAVARSNAAERTIVVGAATPELQPASFTNSGPLTVWLYAPGDTTGALDIRGNASAIPAATSFAAPHVALAVGILRSFGVVMADDTRDRLLAATWPIHSATAQPVPKKGVLDLVKAAAVRHHAVEVIEDDGSGPVRRTYVGEMTEPRQRIPVCGGVVADSIQAVRLGPADASGDRRVILFRRAKKNGVRPVLERPCRQEDTVVKLRTLAGVEKEFPLTSVTHIQFPWLRK